MGQAEAADISSLSMYQRLGGAAALADVVDRLYGFILEDPLLRPLFTGVELVRLKRHMVALLSQVLGGPKGYKGRELAAAHAQLAISGAQYQRVDDYLAAALLIAHAPREVVEALGDVLANSRDQIATRSLDGVDGLPGWVG